MQAGRQQSCHPACDPPRDRPEPCRRPFPASQGHEPRQQSCHGSCSYPPAVSCSLRISSVTPTLITKSGTEHATASGAVWLRHFNASLLLCPAAVPGGPDTGHASKAVMSCAQFPGALAPSMRHTHRVNACRRLVRRVTPMNRGSMVSSIRLRTTNGEGRREKRLSSAKARSACGGEARDGDVSQQPGKLDSSASSGKSTPPNGGSLDRAQKGLLRGPISQNPWEALPQ